MIRQTPKVYRNERDMFDSYTNKYNLSASEFSIIVKTFFYVLMNKLLEGKVYRLPHGAGQVGVYKKAMSNTNRGVFDYQTYKTTGIKRYHKNAHTGGFVAHFYWRLSKNSTDIAPSYLRNLYKYEAPRDMKRTLAKLLKTTGSVYKYYDYE